MKIHVNHKVGLVIMVAAVAAFFVTEHFHLSSSKIVYPGRILMAEQSLSSNYGFIGDPSTSLDVNDIINRVTEAINQIVNYVDGAVDSIVNMITNEDNANGGENEENVNDPSDMTDSEWDTADVPNSNPENLENIANIMNALETENDNENDNENEQSNQDDPLNLNTLIQVENLNNQNNEPE